MITKAGRKQLIAETKNWERVSGIIGRLLRRWPMLSDAAPLRFSWCRGCDANEEHEELDRVFLDAEPASHVAMANDYFVRSGHDARRGSACCATRHAWAAAAAAPWT